MDMFTWWYGGARLCLRPLQLTPARGADIRRASLLALAGMLALGTPVLGQVRDGQAWPPERTGVVPGPIEEERATGWYESGDDPYAVPVSGQGAGPGGPRGSSDDRYAASAQAAGPAQSSASEPHEVGSDLNLKASWRNGLEIESAHKDFRIHVGGRTQFDAIWLDASAGALDGAGGAGEGDSLNFRRARFRIDGTFWELCEFAAEYDFVNSVNDNVGLQPPSETLGNVIHVTSPTDLWWDVKEVPVVGHIRVGQFKEPLGLEHNNSSRFLDFLERSFNQDAFTGPFNNGFSPGIMVWNMRQDKRFTYAVGIFKTTNNVFGFGVGDGEYAVTARLTGLPIYDEPSNGRFLVHVGGAVSYRALDDHRIRIRSRASLRNGPGILNPVLVDTGFFTGDSQTLLVPELAVVWGPLHLQAEYAASLVDNARHGAGAPLGTAFAHGYYVQAMWFLTGEHRAYDYERAAFTRVVPYENAYVVRRKTGPAFGRGAWQLGVRYAQLDLRDPGLDGGVVEDVTIGVNWFWNPNLKIQANYVFASRVAPGGGGGDINGFGMRLAHDF